MKKAFLYIMAFMYAAAGVYHFINPDFYKMLMPAWLPNHSVLNIAGGIGEIILAILLLSHKTRVFSSYLIIAMLVVFLLVIHIPMTMDFYMTGHPALWISIIRLPIQFVLIWWAWIYTKSLKS
jgi:uncharacterized membrane protein